MNVPYNKAPNSSALCQSWYDRYFNTVPESLGGLASIPASEGSTDVYITSFANSFFIDYQIKTLRRFLLSPHNIIVVDTNQNLNPEVSAAVLATCVREKVIYIKAPDNHYQEAQHFDPTLKLGTTLSWIFHNVVKQRQPKYFGFLDHDCFLFSPTTIEQLMPVLPMYGTVSRNGATKWNLHVIANFFLLDYVMDKPLDFRASYKHGLDTGGANYDILYADKNLEDYRLEHIGVRYTDADISRNGGVQHYEIIDNRWIHSPAIGEDQRVGDPGYEKKLMYIRGFLEGVLRTNSLM